MSSSLFRIVLQALSSFSTACTIDAPRESASNPIAPEPAKRSRKFNPRKSPNSDIKEEKSPSRARSDVGRVAPATDAGILLFTPYQCTQRPHRLEGSATLVPIKDVLKGKGLPQSILGHRFERYR